MKKQNKVIRNIKYFIPMLLKTSPMTIVMTVLSALLDAVGSFIYIYFPAAIIDELLGNRNISTLVIYVSILVGSFCIVNILESIASNIRYYYVLKVGFIIDRMINNKIMEVDYFNIENPMFIDSMHRAKNGMSQYTNGIYSFVFALQYILSNAITILGVIGIVFSSKQYLVIIVAAIGVSVNIIIYQKMQNSDQKFRDKMARTERRTNYYNRTISGFRLQKELRLFSGRKMINDIANIENKISHDQSMEQAKKRGIINSLSLFSDYTARFMTIMLLGYAVLLAENPINIATFTMLYAAILTLNDSTANFVYSFQSYLKECDYQNAFIDLMEKESIFKNGKLSIDKIESIEFKSVSFKYPRTDKLILDNVSFVIDKKQKISLVGLNGSGKTTIIKLLCRFFEVDRGEILVNGINIKEYDYKQYMNHMAIVFQDYKILSFSVKTNVALLDDNQEKLYDCFERAQILEKILSLPDKEATYVNKWFDKTGVEFSGGELQKFALSRVLYKDSDFIVLDEPTSALDPEAEAKIYYNFNDIIGKKLTLFISHRLSSCIFSDKILVLDGAKIVETGTHKELMKMENGLYAKMFNAQSEYYK